MKKLSRTQALAVVASIGLTAFLILDHIQAPADAAQIEEVLLTLIFFFL